MELHSAFRTRFITSLALVALLYSFIPSSSVQAESLPYPEKDAPLAKQAGDDSIVLAGGCFWGMQAVFQHVKGVKQVTSGYAGGEESTAHYEEVSSGTTGHAESVKITYDPSQVTLGKILKVYFAVAHDPTMLNYQYPDQGTQYRSAIFFANPYQKAIAEAYIAQLDSKKIFPKPIVTTLEPLKGFYAAEDYHQNYLKLHPDQPYIARYDLPKLEHLKTEIPELYTE